MVQLQLLIGKSTVIDGSNNFGIIAIGKSSTIHNLDGNRNYISIGHGSILLLDSIKDNSGIIWKSCENCGAGFEGTVITAKEPKDYEVSLKPLPEITYTPTQCSAPAINHKL